MTNITQKFDNKNNSIPTTENGVTKVAKNARNNKEESYSTIEKYTIAGDILIALIASAHATLLLYIDFHMFFIVGIYAHAILQLIGAAINIYGLRTRILEVCHAYVRVLGLMVISTTAIFIVFYNLGVIGWI